MKKGSYIFLIVIISLFQQSCLRYHMGFSKEDQSIDKTNVFPDEFVKALYKTNIKFFRKEYSGLMFFKKNSDIRGTRMIFMSEFGLKFFDFKLSNDGEFSVEYIIDELNKEGLISVLEQDMRLLFQKTIVGDITHYSTKNARFHVDKFQHGKNRYYYFFDNNKKKVSKIEYSGRSFKKIKIEINEYKQGVPSFIKVKHINIFLKLDLKLIR